MRDYLRTMKKSLGGATVAAIDAFEKRQDLELPAPYREFLLQANGGKPMLAEFMVDSWGSSRVTTFFGLVQDPSYNLDRYVEVHRESLAITLLPIGCDPGGNVIAIRVAGEYAGRVEFAPHDFVDRDEVSEVLPSYPVARDFDEFFAGLQPDGAFD